MTSKGESNTMNNSTLEVTLDDPTPVLSFLLRYLMVWGGCTLDGAGFHFQRGVIVLVDIGLCYSTTITKVPLPPLRIHIYLFLKILQNKFWKSAFCIEYELKFLSETPSLKIHVLKQMLKAHNTDAIYTIFSEVSLLRHPKWFLLIIAFFSPVIPLELDCMLWANNAHSIVSYTSVEYCYTLLLSN